MNNNMLEDISEVYYSKEQLDEITSRIGKAISEDYKDKNLLMISVLKGSVIFMADLMRKITIPCRIDFITAASYGAGTASSGKVEILNELSEDVKGYDIIIVEDILDSGHTLQRLTDILWEKQPSSIKICTLLDKPARRDPSVKIKADYIGAEVKDEFVVGYGLDYDQKYRNLPFIGILKEEAINSK